MQRRLFLFAAALVIFLVSPGQGQKGIEPEGTEVTLTCSPPKINFGESTVLKAHVTPVEAGRLVLFSFGEDEEIDTADTDGNGDATLEFTPGNSGPFEIAAVFESGDDDTANLDVIGDITLTVDPPEINFADGDFTTLNADLDGAPAGRTVTFSSGSEPLADVDTDPKGHAEYDYYPPHVGHFSVSAKADDYVTADGELQVTGPDPTPTPTPTPCPHLIFVASSATIAAGASPSHPVGGCTYGFTYPENVNIGIDACRDGTGWHCILVSLAGNYSKQARLLPGQQEVTGPGGNTSRMNFCPQATELNALGGCPGIWYMLRAVEDHESVHEGHFLPAFRTVAPQIETEIETLGVPDTGQSAAEAIAAIQALPGFTNGTAHAQQLWLGEILNLAAGDHSGPTDAAEHAVVDPMVTAICASSSILGTCPVCPTPTPTPSATP